MKLKQSKGGIVYPEPPKGPSKVYTFEVSYLQNLSSYILLLHKNNAQLLSVVKTWLANGLNGGWIITYIHHEPIEMEVWC